MNHGGRKKNRGRKPARGNASRRFLHRLVEVVIRKKPLTYAAVVLVPIVSLASGWKLAGADNARTEIYEPLHAELIKMQYAMAASSLETVFPTTTLAALRETGRIQRIPSGLRAQVETCYARANRARSELPTLMVNVAHVALAAVRMLRNEEADKIWMERTVYQLNRDNETVSTADFLARFTLNHTRILPALDVRDPKRLRFSQPAGLTWQVNDWIHFPESVAEVDAKWSNEAWLCFTEQCSRWDQRITRSDLVKAGLTLRQFVGPLRGVLDHDEAFRAYTTVQPDALTCLNELIVSVGSRIGTPRQWRDLFD